MIRSKKDLYDYLIVESRTYKSQQNVISRFLARFLVDPLSDQRYIWKYIRTLRLLEYYNLSKSVISKIFKLYYTAKLQHYSYKTGFQIAPGSIGKGLIIWHWGMIIIHQDVKIGTNCTLHPNIVIGKRKKEGAPPVIGNNCYICSGARILGSISIGNNVTIAPNTVVFKNVPSNCVVAGNPAVIIKQEGKKVNIPLV